MGTVLSWWVHLLKTWDEFESLTLVQCSLVNVLTQEGSPLQFSNSYSRSVCWELRGSVQYFCKWTESEPKAAGWRESDTVLVWLKEACDVRFRLFSVEYSRTSVHSSLVFHSSGLVCLVSV